MMYPWYLSTLCKRNTLLEWFGIRLLSFSLCVLLFVSTTATGQESKTEPATADPVVAPPSFRLDIMPVLFRAGCNSGPCHGSARGKDGYMLSLFGYDPAGDYRRTVEEIPNRRINIAVPSESLLLLKATASVPHTGGKLFDTESELYRVLLRWIEAGAPDDQQVNATTEISAANNSSKGIPEVQGITFSQDTIVFDSDSRGV